jgi:hypothetical protein
MLDGDPFGLRGRPDCATLLTPEQQQAFLSAYAVDFFNAVFGDAQQEAQSKLALGMTPSEYAPNTLYGLPARVAAFYPAEQRTVLFTPASEAELTTNALGGAVTTRGLTMHFCPEGHYTPVSKPGSEPCRRVNVSIPGQPALAVISWPGPSAVTFAIPEGKRDLRDAVAISLRVAVNPLSELNAPEADPTLLIRVTDGKGQSVITGIRAEEPALRFPVGEVEADEMFGPMFTGKAPLTTLRVPRLELIDWSDVREVSLVTEGSGELFLADVEVVR